jgi:hypothetical protein
MFETTNSIIKITKNRSMQYIFKLIKKKYYNMSMRFGTLVRFESVLKNQSKIDSIQRFSVFTKEHPKIFGFMQF